MSAPPADRPFVTANFAITWDGKISTRNHTPSDFSTKRDKHRLLEIRSKVDAVLASAKTIAADRMTMGLPDETLRQERLAAGLAEYPTRVLLTNSGVIAADLPVFAKRFSPIHVFSTEQMPPHVRSALDGKATLHITPGPVVDLAEMMRVLRQEHGIRRLVCEGGGQVLRSLLVAELIDELHLTLCPRVFGGMGAPTISGLAGEFLSRSAHFALEDFEVIEGECFLRYRRLGEPARA
jgi:riboflavin-specific deaminase-like protein